MYLHASFEIQKYTHQHAPDILPMKFTITLNQENFIDFFSVVSVDQFTNNW